MLTLRKRILLIIGGIVVVAVGILLFVVFRDKEVTETVPVDTVTTEVELPPLDTVEFRRPNTVPSEEVTTPGNPDEVYAKQTARIFVERFWSYSNQNDNQHIDDALALSASGMHSWILSQSQEQDSTYQGVTTEVLSTHILSYSPEKASVEVGARQTTRGIENSNTETKTITAKVDLVKSDTQWLVEGIWTE